MNERDDMNPDTAGMTVTVLEDPTTELVEAGLVGDSDRVVQLLADWNEADLFELSGALLDLRSLIENRISEINDADDESDSDTPEVTR